MNKPVIITADSTVDLSPELRERFGIRVIPLMITLGEDHFMDDGQSFTPLDMYARYHRDGTLPQTSAPGYQELCAQIEGHAEKLGIGVTILQSNHEGDLVDMIQDALGHADAIVINPGAYTHTSIALQDCIRSVKCPCVEVHISNVHTREEFRHHSYISAACLGVICGFGLNSYELAIRGICANLGSNK